MNYFPSSIINLFFWISGRGYQVIREDPLEDHVPRKTLTRTDLKYVIMIRNEKKLPLPNEITCNISAFKSHK